MKKLGIAILLLGSAAGVTLWWTSVRAQEAYRAVVARLDDQPEVRVLETTYERHWLESRAVTIVELRGASGALFQAGLEALDRPDLRARVGLRTTHRIDHGFQPVLDWARDGFEGSPVVARVYSQIAFDQETQAELRRAVGRWPALTADLSVRSSGVVEATLHMASQALEPTLDRDNPSRVRGRWHGLSGEAVLALAGGSAVGRVVVPGLDLAADSFQLSVADTAIGFDVSRDASGVWVGTATQSVGRAEWVRRVRSLAVAPLAREEPAQEVADAPASSGPEAEPTPELVGPPMPQWVAGRQLTAEDLTLAARSDVAAGAVQGTLSVRLASFETRAPDAVPVQVRDAKAELVVRNLDANTLGALWLADELDAPGASREGFAPLAWIQRLAPGSPLLELTSLEASSPWGALAGRGHAKVDATARALLADVATAPRAFEAEASLEGPVGFLDALPEARRSSWEKSGLVARDGARFRCRLQLDHGALTADGEPVPWPGATAELADLSAP